MTEPIRNKDLLDSDNNIIKMVARGMSLEEAEEFVNGVNIAEETYTVHSHNIGD